jgi:hypothetical protein
VMISNLGQITVTATVSTPGDPNNLRVDIFYDCGGALFPIDVAILPNVISTTEARFVANFDAAFRLSCGEAPGKFTVVATDGFNQNDPAEGSPTSPSGLVAKKGPVASICSPIDGVTIAPDQTVVLCGAGYDAEDLNNTTDSWSLTGPSGTFTFSGDLADAAPPGAAHEWNPGLYTVTFTVVDSDGNTATATRTFVVAYRICLLYDPSKPFKLSTSTVPIKLFICDSGGKNLSSSSITLTAVYLQKGTQPPGPVPPNSGTGNNNFRFDSKLAPGGGYIYNLSTKKLTTGAYQLGFTAAGVPQGITTYVAPFTVR